MQEPEITASLEAMSDMTTRPTYEELQDRLSRLEREALERRELETAFEEAQFELERRVEERTAALVATNVRLKREMEERIAAERALNAGEERYRNILETMEDGYFETDLKGNLIFCNLALSQITGLERSELIGMNNRSYMDPADAKKTFEVFSEVYTTGNTVKDFECRITKADGSKPHLELTVSLFWDATGRPKGFRGTVRDVTARWIAESSLREKEERYRTVFETTGTATVIIEDDMTISMANSEFQKLSGYSREEIEGKMKWTIFVVPEDLERMKAYHLERRLQGKAAPSSYEFRFVDRHGKVMDVYIKASLIGNTGRSVSSLTDITPLRQAERLFRDLFNNAEVGLFIVQDRTFRLVNPVFSRMTGYTIEELTGMDSLHLIPSEEREKTAEEVISMLKTKHFSPYELRVRDKVGRERFVMVSLGPIIYEGRTALLGNFMDITEKKAMEEELLRSQKLESLGLLAGGIAHDFNNLLTVILGNIDIARLELPRSSAGHMNLIEAEKACFAAKDLTQRFITFSKGGSPIKKDGIIPETIKETADLALVGSAVQYDIQIGESLWPVSYDEAQIRHALNNILVNAREAMRGSGRIQISLGNVEVGNEGILHQSFRIRQGQYLLISIKDTGPGISKENLSKLFDPYFSTKERGARRGMGLGLTTAYNIMKKHDGYIHVESKAKSGTIVFLYLPAKKPVQFPTEAEDTGTTSILNSASILVMDDEETVRNLTREILERLGFKAVLACDGDEAVIIYKESMAHGMPFDLVFLDLTVRGGMGGKEAMEKLREINPEVKAIVTSGYDNDPVITDFRAFGFSAAMPKPFSFEDLKRTVASILGALPLSGDDN